MPSRHNGPDPTNMDFSNRIPNLCSNRYIDDE